MSERGTTFCDLLRLNLSSTGLSGQLPELPAAAASSLATLDLSNTQLASTLPASWPFNTPYLFYLDLTNTSLRGAIPSSWWDDALSTKQLGPKVPEFLYLADNAFSGTVPLGWAAVFTPADTIRYRHEAVADSREIAELQARLASHGRVRMVELIKTRDAYVTVHRLRYRSEQHTLRTALFPGNKRLCLQPDQTLRLVQDRVQNVPVYQALLEQLCNGGGSKDRSMAAGAALLALMAALAAMVLLGAAYLRHGQVSKRWWQLWRWWRAGYVPAQMDGIASQQCGKEASWHVAAAAAAGTGNALPLNVRPGRRMGAVLQAIELAQASARASGHSAAQHEYPTQQAEQALQDALGDEGPQQAQQAQQQQQQREQHLALHGPQQVPVSAGAEELPPLPLLPSTALVLPQHEGQLLMLGRTSRSMVMLGRLQGVGEVAVKALHISPQLLATARREVRLLRRCANRHPNLVNLHGLCHTHPFLLVVTELCAGGDLQSVLHLPEMRWHARGAQVALDVSRGVAFMHSQGVVWADCKPGNVLLTDSWRAKVTDLGTSRLLRGHSTAQSSATPAYAAPEQLLNGRVGLPSDVFSLGRLLHDLCTGEQPTLAVSGEGRACYRRPLAPGRDCPEAVARLIERCKAPLPADRPTAAAVVAALQSMTHG